MGGKVTMELGWPLPRREDYFRDAVKDARETHRIRFQGDYLTLKLFTVPIGLPKYRLENGRTVSLQAEWLADHSAEPADFFRSDPESDRAQEVQHELLVKLMLKDRKSTRLNSSHRYISYVLFCFKKKKHLAVCH